MLPDNVNKNIFYHLALNLVPGIGSRIGRALLLQFGSAEAIFTASAKELKQVEGINEVKAKSFKDETIMERTAKEWDFVEKNSIQLITCDSELFPTRLNECNDAPTMLFYSGNANLNANKIVAIVGTRKSTDYGTKLTEELVEGLQSQGDILILSGLAHGIDAIAHKAALKNNIPTVGVVGHGLEMMYPASHRQLASDMKQNGGVLSEFHSGTIPDKGNFPARNRIVAGMSDVTIVVESDKKGGALITARMASSYNREVAAFPGRVNDTRSSGCNELIRTNIAAMITGADDLLDLMNWKDGKKKPLQKQLFLNLSPDEQKIMDILATKDAVHADELLHKTDMAISMLAATLLQLEMQGLIKTLPGKFYRLD